ncbi:MAG TPA: hypothetical protein VKA87_07715 [Nitrososphaeraceae archaeon]|nr:hypothetical protein [Nitrososphaeraceae archaeon]
METSSSTITTIAASNSVRQQPKTSSNNTVFPEQKIVDQVGVEPTT